MTEPTLRPEPTEQLARMSRLAEEIHAQLNVLNAHLRSEGGTLPDGVMAGLRQLSGNLMAIQGSVTEREQERRNLQALAEMGPVINSSLELTTVLNEVIDTIIRITGAERAFLMLRNERDEMETVVARNWEREDLGSEEIEISETITGRVLHSGDAIMTTNALSDPRFGDQDSIVAYNLRSILCVPLKVKGSTTGVIYADNKVKEGLFTERERSLLTKFSHQAAVALENARLFASVQNTLDEVTELKNLMQDVFASIASGVLTADVEDRITLCNRALVDILALPASETIGSQLGDILPEAELDLEAKIHQAKFQDERFIGVEINPTIRNQGMRSLSLNITPLKTAEGETRGVAIVVEDLTEKRHLEAQGKLFERMVSPAVIRQLDPDSLRLGGSIGNITTLFADIRGYTAFSEGTNPTTLVSVLNRYLSAAAEAVLHHEGTIDKFLGDGIMAWFNAPIPQQDHTQRAVAAAIKMQQMAMAVHDKLPVEFHLSLGVGIHYGEALLGLVGSHQRLDYTALGDSVNIAKRLQEAAAPGQILISKEVVERLGGQATARSVRSLEVHGRRQPIQAFEILDFSYP